MAILKISRERVLGYFRTWRDDAEDWVDQVGTSEISKARYLQELDGREGDDKPQELSTTRNKVVNHNDLWSFQCVTGFETRLFDCVGRIQDRRGHG